MINNGDLVPFGAVYTDKDGDAWQVRFVCVKPGKTSLSNNEPFALLGVPEQVNELKEETGAFFEQFREDAPTGKEPIDRPEVFGID